MVTVYQSTAAGGGLFYTLGRFNGSAGSAITTSNAGSKLPVELVGELSWLAATEFDGQRLIVLGDGR